MDWSRSYSSTWRVFRVNRNTWADAERLENVMETSIVKTADGKTIESGSMKITGDFEPDYYRIVLTAEQGGEIERVDVATLLFNVTGGEYNYGVNTNDVDGYSVLYPASVKTITSGEYAPAGVDGALYSRDLLADAINAPVEVEGSFRLEEHLVHEVGSPVLDAVWSVLSAGDFVIQIDGSGIVHIRPKPTEPALVLDGSFMANGIRMSSDMSDIPNRYIVIDGTNITVAVNNDPDSVVSYASRGYHVDIVDTSPTPVNGETYGAYAEKMLKKNSLLKDEREYTREFAPDVYPYSIVGSAVEGLDGNMRVESQSISCSNGISITEKSTREVQLYE